jgi:fructosamine-3-kinase
MAIESRIAGALGRGVRLATPLAGGCVASVLRADLADGSAVVVKHGGSCYLTEASMLGALAERSRLPVPRVLHAEPDLLILEHIDNDGRLDAGVERHAAELLAELHNTRGPSFGFDLPTLIGPLGQPCPPTDSWLEFFAEHRLRHFGALARGRGAITAPCWDALRRLADRVGEVLREPDYPSLIHGDVWGGNVLCRAGRVAAFIDPATHYAHPEVELAFGTLFSTFGAAFFERYTQLRPVEPGFFERRRGVYNLYPLLVHAILFGGGYGREVEANARRALA